MHLTKNLIDFHCHLDLYPDHESAVQEAENARVYTLAVTTTPRAWPRNYELTRKTRYVRAALGLHPQLVAERSAELALWDAHLGETRFVGEVGLDAGPRHYASFALQKQVFAHILRSCAKAGGKVLSVHSVRSSKVVLDYIETYLPVGQGQVVLHWFTGSKSDLKRAIDLGCYFSVNRSMLERESGVDLVKSIPLNRLLTETDGPFTKLRDLPAKPADVWMTVEAIATIHMLTPQALASLMRVNLELLLTPDEYS